MRSQDFPIRVYIETCTFCNAKCTICPYTKLKRKHEIMDFKLFEKIIDELKEREYAEYISPFLMGEPLLVPNYLDYLRLIRAKVPKAIVLIYTNASMLNEEIGETIIKEHLLDRLYVSFDGGTKESFESIRRNLSFESVKQNIHHFIEYRDTFQYSKPHVAVNMVVTPENSHSKRALRQEFKDADEIRFAFQNNWGGGLEGLKRGDKRGELQKSSKFKDLLTKANFCERISQDIVILTNGDVPICCHDYEGKELMGNIKNNSIEQIWNGALEKKRYLLKKRRYSELPVCSCCNMMDQNPIVQQLVKMKPLLQENVNPRILHMISNLYYKTAPRSARFKSKNLENDVEVTSNDPQEA